MIKTTITDLPLEYDRNYTMTVLSTYNSTMTISIDGRKFVISIPKNISWSGTHIYKGMVCVVRKEVYYSGTKKYAKLELIKVIREDYYEKENNYKEAKPYNSILQYYEVLQCSVDSSMEMIKKNYRMLIRQYHYDTLVSKDLPKDMLEYAENKAKLINEAYEILKKLNN